MCQKKKQILHRGVSIGLAYLEACTKQTQQLLPDAARMACKVSFVKAFRLNQWKKLCMQVVLRRRGRTEVAIGLSIRTPEAKARKSKD